MKYFYDSHVNMNNRRVEKKKSIKKICDYCLKSAKDTNLLTVTAFSCVSMATR